eukprot:gnl/TRDRNA2_/TRDRNA2_164193_c1_seq3.p1 gnl/TRDRNA2_/TRDRNA2_164193_c1~~gnl/TRDRNA2_/TRDRNA2_164193_c1_seq3.p1  ORF type:complete len:211 (-),score=48.66 gnl/TRDRNA2_/TRDRNA2_164193_c1_seq3:165-749(-)
MDRSESRLRVASTPAPVPFIEHLPPLPGQASPVKTITEMPSEEEDEEEEEAEEEQGHSASVLQQLVIQKDMPAIRTKSKECESRKDSRNSSLAESSTTSQDDDEKEGRRGSADRRSSDSQDEDEDEAGESKTALELMAEANDVLSGSQDTGGFDAIIPNQMSTSAKDTVDIDSVIDSLANSLGKSDGNSEPEST